MSHGQALVMVVGSDLIIDDIPATSDLSWIHW